MDKDSFDSAAQTKRLNDVLDSPIVKDGFPYRTIVPIRDARTSDAHRAIEAAGLDGTSVFLASDPVFKLFQPPWGRRHCRCGWIALTVRQAARMGVRGAQAWLALIEQAENDGTFTGRISDYEPARQWVAKPAIDPSAVCEPGHIYATDLRSLMEEITASPCNEEPLLSLAAFLCEARSHDAYRRELQPIAPKLQHAFAVGSRQIRILAAIALLILLDFAPQTANCLHALLAERDDEESDLFDLRVDLSGPNAVKRLMEAMLGGSVAISRIATNTLCTMEIEAPEIAAVCLVVAQETDKSLDDRSVVIEYLSRHRLLSQLPVNLLTDLLHFPRWTTRTAAAEALVALAERSVPELLKLLSDKNAKQRVLAADLLGRIGSSARDSLPHLQRRANDKPKHVRTAVENAIAKICPSSPHA